MATRDQISSKIRISDFSFNYIIDSWPILGIIAALEVVFLSLPSIIIFITSFESTTFIHFPPDSLSLKWYLSIPQASAFVAAFYRSLYVSTFATVLCAIFGTMAAYGIMRYNIRLKKPIQAYFLLPFIVPLVASGMVLYIIYIQIGLIGNTSIVGFTLALVMFPLMFWTISSSVNSLDPTLEYAAKNLGAEELQTFLFVTLPLIAPGIVSGSLLVFIICMNEFVVSLFVTTPSTVTLPVMLYNSIKESISPFLSAVSVIYIVLACLAIAVFDRYIGLERFFHS